MRRQMSTQWAELLSVLAACIVDLLALGIRPQRRCNRITESRAPLWLKKFALSWD